MPRVAEEIWQQLGLTDSGVQRSWSEVAAERLQSDTTINRGAPIFPRIDLERVAAKLGSEEKPVETGKPDEQAAAQGERMDRISFEDFSKLDLRIGKVLEASRVPDADKLLVLQIDVGEQQPRQVVAGLAEHFNPRQLLGRTVVLVANLEPATIHGTESNGMILAAGEKQPLALVTTDAEVKPGEKVR